MKTLKNLALRVLAVVAFALMFAYAVMMLQGCPPPRPRTGAECATDETRLTCGMCSSDPACAWCASESAAQRGCHDRSRPFACDGPIVRVLEGCPDDARGELAP